MVLNGCLISVSIVGPSFGTTPDEIRCPPESEHQATLQGNIPASPVECMRLVPLLGS